VEGVETSVKADDEKVTAYMLSLSDVLEPVSAGQR